MKENTNTKNQTTSRYRDYLLRIVRSFDFKFWAFLILISLGVVTFLWMVHKVISAVSDEARLFVDKIENPIERGCAYIALSIFVLAIVVALKNFTTDKVQITNKD